MKEERIKTAIIAVIIENESGALARVVGLFSGRGYNIESLTVSEIDSAHHMSRITIVTSGTEMVIAQIKAQLERLVPVHGVLDLSEPGPHVERELALIKVVNRGDPRTEAMRIADAFHARIVDVSATSCVYEVTGSSDKVTAFIELLLPLGVIEVARTGIVAMTRGAQKSFQAD
ncbi:Acetolactate synthase small subunit [Acetobacteraceae bacterium EV16G]|uniref:Acetolactate synthase small subunit n=1 Tax=Sorlinia euscelidii TaxID=3081148 RepID=A0ABU7U2B6_9PROT